MKKTIVLFCVFALALCSCASTGGVEENRADDISGIYVGVIPAADCPGICVAAILDAQTGRYRISYQYLDRDVDLDTSTGTFLWNRETGLITLESKDTPRYYRAGNGVITQLDTEGNDLPEKTARNYALRKAEFFYD